MKIILFIFIAVVIIAGGYFFVKQISGNKLVINPSVTPSGTVSPTPLATPTSVANPTFSILPENMKIVATIKTAKGNIELELYPKIAPKTVSNFVGLAENGFYDGTKFHRVVDDFVIQGGDPLSKIDDPRVGSGGPGYRFDDEINAKSLGLTDAVITQLEAQGYKYDNSLQSMQMKPGVIAMANAGPNTNGSQFFIVTTKDQPYLNGKHTVFGKVVKGMDVVLKIKQGDVIEKISIVKK